MRTKDLKILSYIYLILPIIIFAIGWLKPIISVPVTLMLLTIIYLKFREKKDKAENIKFIKKRYIILIFLVLLIICITAGQGNMFYQSYDWHWRNAIFRDLINMEWPVHYENMDADLTYYIGFWMFPAAIAKIFLAFFGENVAWVIGNIIALLWCAIGILLTILWVFRLLKIKKKKDAIIALIIFFGFSGLDILGVFILKNNLLSNYLHAEWWAYNFQFSSTITQLFWVYNQCVVSWLITMMFINEKKCNNYLLIILLCLPYGPLPFVGLIPLFAVRGIKYLIKSIKKHKIKEFFKDVFSIQNILALIAILPIYYFYYTGNSATTSGGFRFDTAILNPQVIKYLLVFYILEVLVYAIFLVNKNKKDELIWVAVIELFFIPFFKIGNSIDFSMRASIPPLMILTFYLIKYIKNAKLKDIKTIILIVIFLIGTVTPILEYVRAINTIIENNKIDIVADDIKTFSNKELKDYQNFVSPSNSKFSYIKK